MSFINYKSRNSFIMTLLVILTVTFSYASNATSRRSSETRNSSSANAGTSAFPEASHYADMFDGRLTGSQERYCGDESAHERYERDGTKCPYFSAAFNRLGKDVSRNPLKQWCARITNIENNRSIIVRINDTGHPTKLKNRIDLTKTAKKAIGAQVSGLGTPYNDKDDKFINPIVKLSDLERAVFKTLPDTKVKNEKGKKIEYNKVVIQCKNEPRTRGVYWLPKAVIAKSIEDLNDAERAMLEEDDILSTLPGSIIEIMPESEEGFLLDDMA